MVPGINDEEQKDIFLFLQQITTLVFRGLGIGMFDFRIDGKNPVDRLTGDVTSKSWGRCLMNVWAFMRNGGCCTVVAVNYVVMPCVARCDDGARRLGVPTTCRLPQDVITWYVYQLSNVHDFILQIFYLFIVYCCCH